MRARSEIPPPLELECLKALWDLKEANVHQVREALQPRRALAYTTVLTILDRLEHRGAVARRKSGRSFLYSPLLTREALRRLAVDDLIESLFANSAAELIAYLGVAGAQPQPEPETPERGRHADLDAALL
jgi:predicted transcriptional regulator